MGVGATGRIISPQKSFKEVLRIEVERYDRRKAAKSKDRFTKILRPTAICSQCNRRMEKKIADLQIENKRENAPICVACILGVKRKEIPTDRLEHFSEETKIKFGEFKNRKSKKEKVVLIDESPFIGFY